jgi:hypothetical protein
MDAAMESHFKRPGWFTVNVVNRLIAALMRLGISVWGSRILEVRGRSSGQWRRIFEGVGPDATDEELARAAPKHPVFRLGSSPR